MMMNAEMEAKLRIQEISLKPKKIKKHYLNNSQADVHRT